MAQQQNQPAVPPKKGTSVACIIGGVCGGLTIIGLVIALILVIFVFRSCAPFSLFSRFAGNETTNESNQSTNFDQALVGTWESGCLVPDPDSPWSEKHQFVIKSDGTATHTRWSNDTMAHDCAATMTLVNHYKLAIAGAGQINLTDTDNNATSYDIYQVAGNTLYFGHGFRGDNSGYAGPYGESPSSRITALNTFIAYHQ